MFESYLIDEVGTVFNVALVFERAVAVSCIGSDEVIAVGLSLSEHMFVV